MLLAVATLFSLAAPAFAEEAPAEPVVTEEPVVEAAEEPVVEAEVPVEEAAPVEEATPVEEPMPVEAAEEPVVTEEPVEEPEAAEALEEVEEPAAIDEPMPAEGAATSGSCGNGVTWSLSGDGTLTISGSGAMDVFATDDYGNELSPWRALRDQVTKIVVQFGVTSIGSNAFYRCDNLVSVDIPASVTSIGEDVFPLYSITDISVDGNNQNYASVDGVLFNADKTTLIRYPCAKTAASYAIPDTVRTIGEGAFSYTTKLTSVRIPDGVTAIGNGAFNWCLSLTEVNIPASVKTIGNFAFDTCKMTSLEIPEGVVSIGEWAFHGCKLTSVTVPASVTYLGEEAFYTDTLKSITVLNPDCVIGHETYKEGDEHYASIDLTLGDYGTVIYSYDGSTAEAYAKRWGYTFKSLGSVPQPTATPKPTATPTPAKLATPKITKMENTASGLKVTWGKVDGAVRYTVFYKLKGASKWTKIGTTTATSYTRKAKDLKSGKTYVFTIRCVKNDKKTYTSDYDKTGKSLTYYAAPTVKIAKASNGGIKVTWNKVAGASRYMVYYKENGGSWKRIGTTTATSYTRAASKLKNGVTYEFTVRCVKNDKKTMLSSYKASNSLKYKK